VKSRICPVRGARDFASRGSLLQSQGLEKPVTSEKNIGDLGGKTHVLGEKMEDFGRI